VLLLVAVLSGCAGSPEARRDKFLARGKVFLEKKDYARALLEFSNAARATPRDAEPYYYAGMASLGSGDLQRAYNTFLKALELNPKHINARLRVAQLMTTGGQEIVRDAEKELTELVQAGQPTPEMLNSLAVAELKLGKTDDAIQTLEDALTKTPGSLMSSLLLARAKLAAKDASGAEEVLRKATEASPKDVLPQLLLARFYVAMKKDAEAEQAIQRALQLDPKSTAALRDLAFLQNRTGRTKEAEDNLKKLSVASESSSKPLYALFLYSQGRRDEAVRELERLVKEDPQDRILRSKLVIAYQAVNRPADARRVVDQALKKNSKDLEARLQRGQMLAVEGKYVEAEADLNAVIGQKPDLAAGRYAIAKVHQAQGRELQYRQDLFKTLELDPMLVKIRVELAGELIVNKLPKEALDLMNKTPDAQKNSLVVLAQRNWALWASGSFQEMRQGIDRGLSQARTVELLIQDGLWKLNAGNANAARASLEEALKTNPGDIRALTGLKDAYLMLKQAPMAVQKVKEYASQQPKSAPVQEFLGFVLWGSGDKTGARAAFTAAKAADPKYRSAELAAVQIDAQEAKWDDAAAKLNAMLTAEPSNATARLWLGNIEVARGNRGAALENFRKALETSPENPQVLNNFAYLLAEQANKPAEAQKYAEQAVAKSPDNPEFADTLGWILYRNGFYSLALNHLERAVSKGKNPVAKYHLAMAYAKTGDMQRGRLALEQARKQNARLPEAAMAAEALAAH